MAIEKYEFWSLQIITSESCVCHTHTLMSVVYKKPPGNLRDLMKIYLADISKRNLFKKSLIKNSDNIMGLHWDF